MGEKFFRTFSTQDGEDVLDQLRRDLKVDDAFYPEEDAQNRKPIDPITMAMRQGRVSVFNMIRMRIDQGK